MRILLIEDSPTQAEQIRRWIGQHDVTVVDTAAKASRMIADDWDVIIADVVVPGALVDGSTIETWRLRSRCPVFAISALVTGVGVAPKTEDTIRGILKKLSHDSAPTS